MTKKTKKRRSRAKKKTLKRRYKKNSENSEIILQLKTILRTNPTVRKKLLNILKNPKTAPSWKNKTLNDVVNFFSQWLTQIVNPTNPAQNVQLFGTLAVDTLEGQILMKDTTFAFWIQSFQNFRYRFLNSPQSAKNMHQLVTYIPKHSDEGGFDMQCLPPTKNGGFGNLMQGTPHQIKIVKKYGLKNKLIMKDNTSTLDINKKMMVKLFNFKTFRDFFLRRYLPGTRPLNKKPKWWIPSIKTSSKTEFITAPADGKIKWIFQNAGKDKKFNIKQETMSLRQHFNICDVLSNPKHKCHKNKYLEKFEGGPMLTTLLWFTNYHHFHAPVSGEVIEINDYATSSINLNHKCGDVARAALTERGPSGVESKDSKWQKRIIKKYGNKANYIFNWFDELSRHRRATYLYDTDVEGGSKIGLVMMMPIGFYGVGAIHTKIQQGYFVTKGEEVGHFEYGASSVVLVFEPNRVDIAIPNIKSEYPFSPDSSKYMSIKVREAIAVAKNRNSK